MSAKKRAEALGKDNTPTKKRIKKNPMPKSERRSKNSKNDRPKNIYNSSFGKNVPAELFRKDLISAMKLPDSEHLELEDYCLITDHWKQEWEKGVQVPVSPESIPQPSVRPFSRPNAPPAAFKLPRKLIHISKDSSFNPEIHHLVPSTSQHTPVYDLDDFDLVWLDNFNQHQKHYGMEQVSELTMELLIEEFEKECSTKLQEQLWLEGGLEIDDNSVCDVCRVPDVEEGNEIVFCDACNVGVHQACYGIVNIPAGSWVCRTCALGISPPCQLCPNSKGAMKSTKNGLKWAHVSCALWVPEVTIADPERMEPISKLSEIPASRWNLVCSICRIRKGACIQCSIKKCKTAYHVTCAFNAGLKVSQSIAHLSTGDDIFMKSYCRRHSRNMGAKAEDDEEEEEEEEEVPPSANQDKPESSKPKGCRGSPIDHQFYKHVKPDIIALRTKVRHEIVLWLYTYWVLKRRSGGNKSLLKTKLLEEKPTPSKEKKEKGLVMRMKMFVSIRQELERLRNLCYMVSKRERHSKQLYTTAREIFQKQCQILNAFPDMDAGEVVDATQPQTLFDQIYEPSHFQDLEEKPLPWESLQILRREIRSAGSPLSNSGDHLYGQASAQPHIYADNSDSDAFYESEDDSYEESRPEPDQARPLPESHSSPSTPEKMLCSPEEEKPDVKEEIFLPSESASSPDLNCSLPSDPSLAESPTKKEQPPSPHRDKPKKSPKKSPLKEKNKFYKGYKSHLDQALHHAKHVRRKPIKLFVDKTLYVDLNLYHQYRTMLKCPHSISPQVVISGRENLRKWPSSEGPAAPGIETAAETTPEPAASPPTPQAQNAGSAKPCSASPAKSTGGSAVECKQQVEETSPCSKAPAPSIPFVSPVNGLKGRPRPLSESLKARHHHHHSENRPRPKEESSRPKLQAANGKLLHSPKHKRLREERADKRPRLTEHKPDNTEHGTTKPTKAPLCRTPLPEYLSPSVPSFIKLSGYKIPKKAKPDCNNTAAAQVSPLSRLTSVNGHTTTYACSKNNLEVRAAPLFFSNPLKESEIPLIPLPPPKV